MTCIITGGAFICSTRSPCPTECRDLTWSEGRACRKCAYRRCEFAGKTAKEARIAIDEMMKKDGQK